MDSPPPDLVGLSITVIRALASLLGAVAAIAALLTQTAFERRAKPLGGVFKGSPFETQQFTPWGRLLLVVIVVAAGVQFAADWAKDQAADAQVKGTTKDLKQTVADASNQARMDIDGEVKAAADKELAAEMGIFKAQGSLSDKASANLRSANQIFEQTQRLMEPINSVSLEYFTEIPSGFFDADRYLRNLRGSISLINTLGGSKGFGPWADRAGFEITNPGTDATPLRSISITPRSAFFPKTDEKGNFQYDFMQRFQPAVFRLEIFKNRNNAIAKVAELEKHSNACGVSGNLDISFNYSDIKTYKYLYSLNSPNDLVIDFRKDNIDTIDVSKDEQVLSLPDLSRAAAIVSIAWGAGPPKLSRDSAPRLLRLILTIRGHVFNFMSNEIMFADLDPGCSVFMLNRFEDAHTRQAIGAPNIVAPSATRRP